MSDDSLKKMAIADLRPGERVHEDVSGESSYNYDHILGPEHIAEGYSLSIKENYPHNFSVHLHHSGQEQGKLRVSTPSDKAYLKETVIYDKAHHGKGLGKAMLEAAYAHLAHVMKIPTVIGSVHSTSSHLVHESIARKHGLEYKGGNPNLEVAQSAKKWKKMKPEPYDNRYGEYEVELFKALEDIPVGSPKQIGGQHESYDYSHMVPEPLRGKFSIELYQENWPHSPMYSHELHSKIYLHEDGRRFLVGAVCAMKRKTGDVVKISDANIKAPYRNLGLGLAAYESLLGHAVNKMGVKFVRGGTHSSSAEAVHRKLAEKHGFEYVVNPNPHTENVPEGDYDEKFLPYTRRIAKEDLNKALKDVPVGEYKENERGTKMWHYNHVLPQHLYDQGFRLYIDKNHTIWGSGDGWDGWVAKLHLFDKSSGIPLLRRIGIVEGRMSKMTPTDFIIDYANIQGSKGNPKGQDFNDFPMDDNIQENRSADIDKLDFRGRGLGPLMYEALMAHAKNYLGASYARGTSHSSMASGAHKKVAAKHGLDYKPVENPPEFQQKNSTGSFDDKYSDYRYELKSEMNLNKAIKDLRPGKQVGLLEGSKVFDYSHLLDHQHKQEGYSLEVHEHPDTGVDVWVENPKSWLAPGNLTAVYWPDEGEVRPIVAEVNKDHRGKGLGMAMYEALLTHLYHLHGVNTVKGMEHSTAASKVHQKISAKHGGDYKPELREGFEDHPAAPFDAKYKPYKYTIKYDEFDKSILEWSKKIEKKDILPGGLADNKKPSDFDQQSLREGTEVEKEHVDDERIAQEIAMDHLTEDPDYYKKLKAIEKKGKKRKKD